MSLAISSINRPCSEVLIAVRRALSRSGLRSLETFDLRAARLGARERACPYHGTSGCDCEMIVLLIYGRSWVPDTLVLHGSNGRTWLSMPEPAATPVDGLTAAAVEQGIRELLDASAP